VGYDCEITLSAEEVVTIGSAKREELLAASQGGMKTVEFIAKNARDLKENSE